MKLTQEQLNKMFEYGIPGHMHGGLIRYYENQIPPGHFLTAVLSNDLMEACARADHKNQFAIPAYAMWLYNQAPSGSYGSPDKVLRWLAGEHPLQIREAEENLQKEHWAAQQDQDDEWIEENL